ncbi:MAG: phasin family protein [Acetobacteraceae bacterium]
MKDAIDLQTNFARATMEKTMAETGRLTDASFKLTEQALAPITARMTAAVEKMVKPL